MEPTVIECPEVYFAWGENKTIVFGGTIRPNEDLQIRVAPDIGNAICCRWVCGNIFLDGDGGITPKQYYPLYFVGNEYVTSPRQMEVSEMEGEFTGITYLPSTGLGPKLLLDFESLCAYKQHAMSVQVGGWGCKPNFDPLCLMLSCLSVFEEFHKRYLNFLETNNQQVMPSCTPIFCKFIAENANPTWDVCVGTGILLFLSLYKTTVKEEWAAFQNARLEGIKGAFGATEGFQINLSHESVEGLTARITKIPGLITLIWKFLTEGECIPVGIKNYLKILMAYKGMSSFKLSYDFLKEPLSLAHLIHIDVDEMQYFTQVSETLAVEFGMNLPYLSFYAPDRVPASSHYKKLASLSIQVRRLSVRTPERLQKKSDYTFDNLETYYRYKVGPGQNFIQLARLFGLSEERTAKIKQIIEQLGRPLPNIPGVPQIMP